MEKRARRGGGGAGKRSSRLLLPACVLLAAVLWCAGRMHGSAKTVLTGFPDSGRRARLSLECGRLEIALDGQVVWATDEQWRAEDFLLSDINRDGKEELLILVWKRGSYGSVRPFWLEGDETGWFQHIFIYRWEGSCIRPMWMSSRLRPEVRKWEPLSDGRLQILTAGGERTVWGWRTWGLERLDGDRPAV